jgi:pimeloyl-ACP methyl ester carboxylesterase
MNLKESDVRSVITRVTETIREAVFKTGVFLGAMIFIPWWFAFWFWFFFFLDLLVQAVSTTSPKDLINGLKGWVQLVWGVIQGHVYGPRMALPDSSTGDEGAMEVLHVSKDWIAFKFHTPTPTLYPSLSFLVIGGPFYTPPSYTPLARELAKRGGDVVIWNRGFTKGYTSDLGGIIGRIESSGEGTKWVLVGHSLGGILVSKVARALPPALHARIAALIYLASFPAAIEELGQGYKPETKPVAQSAKQSGKGSKGAKKGSKATAAAAAPEESKGPESPVEESSPRGLGMEIPILTVQASEDTVVTGGSKRGRGGVEKGRPRHFPKKSEVHTIVGANHSQFTSVSSLPLDGTATLTPTQQVQQTAAVILDFLARNLPPSAQSISNTPERVGGARVQE